MQRVFGICTKSADMQHQKCHLCLSSNFNKILNPKLKKSTIRKGSFQSEYVQ